ncbi:MAG TPA: POTRA domain-containing protein [Puia sp.]|nr:POTRA domain-containing protein [Puia sp.]
MKYCLILVPAFMFHYSYAQFAERIPARSDTTGRRSDTLPPASPFVIGKIIIKGNKQTKSYIIERELSFKPGDSLYLPDLVKSFEAGRSRLINTALFNEVVIFLKGFRGYIADIEIDVKERWYIFPVPYFKPVDRNLTAWAEKHYSLSRVDYGAKFSHFNFTGRNDNLTAWLITGYSRQFELYYNQPYADKSLKHGFGMGFSYAALKEVDVITVANKQGFINADTIPYAGKYLNRELTFSLRYFYRPSLTTRHQLRLNIVDVQVDSAVTVWNPHYFSNGRNRITYPELSYGMNYTDVDYVAYPLKGIIFETGINRRGINKDMNVWQFYAKLTRSWQLARKTWFGFQNSNSLKLPLSQPFYNQQLVGYGDLFIRGLDRYVIDGVAGVVLRNTLFRELFNFNIPFLHVPSHDHIPIRIYATAFSDYGYVYNKDFKDNSLVNKMLYTAGFGIDLVTFYDISFKFDYSFNQLGQNGLFLHIKNDF